MRFFQKNIKNIWLIKKELLLLQPLSNRFYKVVKKKSKKIEKIFGRLKKRLYLCTPF